MINKLFDLFKMMEINFESLKSLTLTYLKQVPLLRQGLELQAFII